MKLRVKLYIYRAMEDLISGVSLDTMELGQLVIYETTVGFR